MAPTVVAQSTSSARHESALAVAGSDRIVYPTDLFDWAERQFPEYFPSHEFNQDQSPYVYRYYPESKNYLGLAGDRIYVMGPMSNGELTFVDVTRSYLCSVYPLECNQAPTSIASDADAALLAARTDNPLFGFDLLGSDVLVATLGRCRTA